MDPVRLVMYYEASNLIAHAPSNEENPISSCVNTDCGPTAFLAEGVSYELHLKITLSELILGEKPLIEHLCTNYSLYFILSNSAHTRQKQMFDNLLGRFSLFQFQILSSLIYRAHT